MFDLGLSGRKRLLLCLVSKVALALFINISLLSKVDLSAKLKNIAIIVPSLGRGGGQKGAPNSEASFYPATSVISNNHHRTANLKHGTRAMESSKSRPASTTNTP